MQNPEYALNAFVNIVSDLFGGIDLFRINRVNQIVPSEQHVASDLVGMGFDQLDLRSLGMDSRLGGNR